MVLVDTSVWLSALSRDTSSFKSRIQLEELLRNHLVSITDSVRFDLLRNIKNEQRTQLWGLLKYVPIITIKNSSWNIAIQVAWDLEDSTGIVLDNTESLTVAMALQNQRHLFTLNDRQKAVSEIRKLKVLE